MQLFRLFAVCLLASAVCLSATNAVQADQIFVNNRLGDDTFDGRLAAPVSEGNGPVRSLRRALQLAMPGSRIVIANTGWPYRESVSLVGNDNSGTDIKPFEIIGNGAVFDGSRPVPSKAWRELDGRLWMFTPHRKGYYQFLRGDEIVPSIAPVARRDGLDQLPAGHWTVYAGSIYYRSQEEEIPTREPFYFAAEPAGITLYGVHDVEIHDLTFRHYRLDGINAHDRCFGAVLLGVNLVGNGRYGLFVGGSSEVIIAGVGTADNRAGAIEVAEQGLIEEAELLSPPADAAAEPAVDEELIIE